MCHTQNINYKLAFTYHLYTGSHHVMREIAPLGLSHKTHNKSKQTAINTLNGTK